MCQGGFLVTKINNKLMFENNAPFRNKYSPVDQGQSPHKPLKFSGCVVPGEGSVEAEVEDHGVDDHQGHQLYSRLQGRVRFNLKSNQEEGNDVVPKLQQQLWS